MAKNINKKFTISLDIDTRDAEKQVESTAKNIKNALSKATKEGIGVKELREMANTINSMFEKIGQTGPLNIEQDFKGNGSAAKRIEILTNALDSLFNSMGNVNSQSISAGFMNLENVSSAAKREVDKIKTQVDKIKQLKTDLNNAKQAIDDVKSNKTDVLNNYDVEITDASIQSLISEFNVLSNAIDKGDKKSLDYYKNLLKLSQVSLKLNKAFQDVKSNDSIKQSIGSNTYSDLSLYALTKSNKAKHLLGKIDNSNIDEIIKKEESKIESIIKSDSGSALDAKDAGNNIKKHADMVADSVQYAKNKLTKAYTDYYNEVAKAKKSGVDVSPEMERIENKLYDMYDNWKISNDDQWSLQGVVDDILGGKLDANGIKRAVDTVFKDFDIKPNVSLEELESEAKQSANEMSAGLEKVEDKAEGVTYTFKDLVNYISKSGSTPKTFFDKLESGAQAVDGELKKILTSLNLIDLNGNINFKSIKDGATNLGGMISDDNVLIARKNDKLQFAKEAKPKLLEAEKLGANVGTILDIFEDRDNKRMYELQKRVKGQSVNNKYNKMVNTDFLEATDDQIKKLITDLQILQKVGLFVDHNGQNVLYDKNNGFSFIDLASQSTWFTAGPQNNVQENVDKLLNSMFGSNPEINGDKFTQRVYSLMGEVVDQGVEQRKAKLKSEAAPISSTNVAQSVKKEESAHESNATAIQTENRALEENIDLKKKAQTMKWSEFATDDSLAATKTKEGLYTISDAERFWKKANYEKEIDYHEISEREADNIIDKYLSADLRSAWFSSADFNAKDEIENTVLENGELRNATLNKMHQLYKKYGTLADKNLSFNDFLNKELDVYRGDSHPVIFGDDQPLTFSYSYVKADDFNDHVESTKVIPKNTIGHPNYGYYDKEVETFLPSDFLPSGPDSLYVNNKFKSFEEYYNSLDDSLKKALDERLMMLEKNRVEALIDPSLKRFYDDIQINDRDYQNEILSQFKSGNTPDSFDTNTQNLFATRYNELPKSQQKLFAYYATLENAVKGVSPILSYNDFDNLGTSGLVGAVMGDKTGLRNHVAKLTGEHQFDILGNNIKNIEQESVVHEINTQKILEETQAQTKLNKAKAAEPDPIDNFEKYSTVASKLLEESIDLEYIDPKMSNNFEALADDMWNVYKTSKDYPNIIADGAYVNDNTGEICDASDLMNRIKKVEQQYGENLDYCKQYVEQIFGKLKADESKLRSGTADTHTSEQIVDNTNIEKTISSYEELCRVIERFNQLALKSNTEGEKLTKQEDKELSDITSLIGRTKTGGDPNKMFNHAIAWSAMVDPFSGIVNIDTIAKYLGIEIPQAAEKAKQAIKEVDNTKVDPKVDLSTKNELQEIEKQAEKTDIALEELDRQKVSTDVKGDKKGDTKTAVSDDTSKEAQQLEMLDAKLKEVKAAIEAKTQAFREEENIVTAAIGTEVNALNSLESHLESSTQSARAMGSALKDVSDLSSVSSSETVSDNKIQDEINALDQLQLKLKEVKSAIEAKTQEFKDEGRIVDGVVDKEIAALNNLSTYLDTIRLNAKSVVDSLNQINNTKLNAPTGAVSNNNTDNVHYVTDPQGNKVTMYRGISDAYGGLVSNRYHGGTFSTDDLNLAKTYAGFTGKVEKVNLSMKNPLEINAKGAYWNQIEYIGNQFDDISRELHTLKENILDAQHSMHFLAQDSDEYQKLQKEMQDNQARVDSIYADPNNPYGITNTNKIVEHAKSMGHDGVIFKNIVDSADSTYKKAANVMVTFGQDQIHYLDTIQSTFTSAISRFKDKYMDLGQYANFSKEDVAREMEYARGVFLKSSDEQKKIYSEHPFVKDFANFRYINGTQFKEYDKIYNDTADDASFEEMSKRTYNDIFKMRYELTSIAKAFGKENIPFNELLSENIDSVAEDQSNQKSTSNDKEVLPDNKWALDSTLSTTNSILQSILTAVNGSDSTDQISKVLDGAVLDLKAAADALRTSANEVKQESKKGTKSKPKDDKPTISKKIGKEDELTFDEIKNNEISNFEKYKKDVENSIHATDQFKNKLSELELQLKDVNDVEGLNTWKQNVEKFQGAFGIHENANKKQLIGEINAINKDVKDAIKGLDLNEPSDDAERRAAQERIIQGFKEIQIASDICTNSVKKNQYDEISAFNAAKQQLAEKKKQLLEEAAIYRQQYGFMNGGKSGKNYGATAVMRETTRYNKFKQYASDENQGFKDSALFNEKLQQYINAYDRLIAKRQEISNKSVRTDRDEQEFNDAKQAAADYGKEIDRLIAKSHKLETGAYQIGSIGSDINIESGLSRKQALTDFVTQMHNAKESTIQFADNYQKCTFKMKNEDGTWTRMTAHLDKFSNKMYSTAGEVTKYGSAFGEFVGALKGEFLKLGRYMIASFGIEEVIQAVRTGIGYVKEIDDALTDLKKVTNETDAGYERFLQTMSKTAAVVGSTVAELTTMAAEWARLGYSMQQAASLAESTAILLNVSEFEDPTEASEALISTIQAFGYAADDSMHVVDILNEVKVTCLLIQ